MDAQAAECVRGVREIVRAKYPHVALWYNGSLPKPQDFRYQAYTASLQDRNCATLHETQGSQLFDPNFVGHQWRSFYEMLLGSRLTLARASDIGDPALASGFVYNVDMSRHLGPEKFAASRGTWTTANHLGAIMLALRVHPCFTDGTIFRPSTQFMTRYSALLWDRDLRAVPEAWKRLNVESNREVWWEDTVCTREAGGFRDTLVHLVNCPEQEEIDPAVTSDPEPARYVEVEFTPPTDPAQMECWALQPYGYDDPVREPRQVQLTPQVEQGTVTVELPPFTYYTLLVLREKTGAAP